MKNNNQRFRGKKDGAEIDAFYEQIKRERRNNCYFIAVTVIVNILFIYFFSGLFFDKRLYIKVIPAVVCLLNAIVLVKTLPGLFPKLSTIMYLISILSFIGSALIFDCIKSKIEEAELKNHGKKIYAIVSNKEWKTEHNAVNSRWQINATFQAEKKNYNTFFVDDIENAYKIGDSVRVIYSTNNPEISMVILGED
jgi:hypothetical protein